ncbi:unnamed protein product [Coffea canephora]|uniref:DH200=94 genomic scaffold, scaffold_902 n=1 Tax=Coffea canephora TaxID=49390 RepID=A0A068VH05_COFCA|nr:unnamed protein product [Coffea canephora]
MCTILKAWKAGSNFLGTHKKVEYNANYNFTSEYKSTRLVGLSPSVPVNVVLQDWIRHSDGKLSFLGFVRLLHGVPHEHFRRLETTNYLD